MLLEAISRACICTCNAQGQRSRELHCACAYKEAPTIWPPNSKLGNELAYLGFYDGFSAKKSRLQTTTWSSSTDTARG